MDCQTREVIARSIYTANKKLSDKRGDGSSYTANNILSDKRGGQHFAGVVVRSRYFGAVDRYSNKPYLLNLALKGWLTVLEFLFEI